MESEVRTHIVRPLLAWAQSHLRDLPWRRSQNPYHIWVAEVMLQQTRTATVIPYYLGFLELFPTIAELAAAPLDDVLKAWEGLGYYSRARNLHKAAQLVMERYDGQLPADREVLLSLPGIGHYTAGAILSIAFGQPEPVLDGNAKRVLTRVYDISEDIRRTATVSRLWALAEALVRAAPPGEAGHFNQALMELGSTVCTPASPNCGACPLQPVCLAHASGVQSARPVRTRRKPVPHYQVAAAVIWRDRCQDANTEFLIAQRLPEGLLGGLWEFPGGKQEPGETLQETLRREIREELGVEIEVGELLTVALHAYTHFRVTLYAFHCRLVAGEPQTIGVAEWRWVRLDQLDRYAFPKVDHKVIAALRTQSDLESADARQ
ncbi:MAG TPA: A/G-specific adenine glycosylase [Anaerolineae bacterium]|nr:A/G-specific adenine glycosylase [Anaerolineae bacterium]